MRRSTKGTRITPTTRARPKRRYVNSETMKARWARLIAASAPRVDCRISRGSLHHIEDLCRHVVPGPATKRVGQRELRVETTIPCAPPLAHPPRDVPSITRIRNEEVPQLWRDALRHARRRRDEGRQPRAQRLVSGEAVGLVPRRGDERVARRQHARHVAREADEMHAGRPRHLCEPALPVA